jgi:hypothetical protein
MLKDKDCDLAINIDEDAFIVTLNEILELANYVVENNYANAGSPDAGDGCPRGANPIVTNPFFNILNLKLIRSKQINKKEIKSFDYQLYKSKMIECFPKEKLSGSYDFNAEYTEPYYQFFLWLAYNFKTLYLNTQKHPDGISTILYSPNNKIICYHSWFARFYNTPSFFVKFFQKGFNKQKTRIDNLINEVYQIRKLQRPEFTNKDYLRFRKDVLIRWSIKIPQRIANWPNKWKKWYKRRATKNF